MNRTLDIMSLGSRSGEAPEAEIDLIRSIAEGDLAAFERLHQRYYTRLMGFALRMTQRHDAAEEIASDTLMAVWRGAGNFRGESKASTWIFGIAYRQAMKLLSRRKPLDMAAEIDEELPAPTTGEEEVEMLFQRHTLSNALAQLPLEQRATVQLTYVYGYRLSEIAAITGCPEGTVKSRMFHARNRLRALLGGAS
ncbi:MAG: sigma-70 family RNA polymerase sigma factor [Pseudomonadota bacterium]